MKSLNSLVSDVVKNKLAPAKLISYIESISVEKYKYKSIYQRYYLSDEIHDDLLEGTIYVEFSRKTLTSPVDDVCVTFTKLTDEIARSIYAALASAAQNKPHWEYSRDSYLKPVGVDKNTVELPNGVKFPFNIPIKKVVSIESVSAPATASSHSFKLNVFRGAGVDKAILGIYCSESHD